jgi:hypothetical protein
MLANTKIGELIKKLEAISELNMWLSTAGSPDVLELVKLIQLDQLEDGKRPDGTFFDDYSPASVNLYGKPSGPIKWKDSGYFYEGIRAIIGNNEITILNDGTFDEFGSKFDLEIRFKETIIGIQDVNYQKIIEAIKDKYLEELHRLLQFN